MTISTTDTFCFDLATEAPQKVFRMWFETTFFFVQRALQVIHLALAFSVACVNGSYLYFSSAKLSTNADFIICQVIAGLLVLSSATRLFLGEFKGSISRLIDVLCSALWCVAYGLLKRVRCPRSE